jgi:uncharacterized Ntn-hydrolase superfamily protein
VKAQIYSGEQPLAHTYSIVAWDPATGEMGVAVQSHWFSVGTIVTWAEAGVGAIATQSFANPSFGPEGLDLLKKGMAAQAALDELIAADDGRDVRQLAIVDSNGTTAVWTGSKCIPEAGHCRGKHFAVQANLMLNDKVWPAMKEAYERATGRLEERMITALEAAQSAGGDIRGKQSAALLVVNRKATGKPWIDRKTDIRIDDHPEPIKELRRIYNVKCAYDHMNAGDAAMEEKDMVRALEEYAAAFSLYPENPEVRFWTAVTLVNADKLNEALPLFREVFALHPAWKEVVQRIYGTDLLPVSEEVYVRISSLQN